MKKMIGFFVLFSVAVFSLAGCVTQSSVGNEPAAPAKDLDEKTLNIYTALEDDQITYY